MKISQKDLDLLVTSMMNQIYDYDYIKREKEKIKEKDFEKLKKSKAYKDLVKIFDANPDIASINIFDTFYKWTVAFVESQATCTTNIHRKSIDKDLYSRFIYANVQVDYPDAVVVQNRLRSTLAIELIWGNDLKKALSDVAKAIKKEFKLV